MNDPADTFRRYLELWFPSPGWSQLVRPAYRTLTVPGVSWSDAVPAWVQLAIMLGDTGAAPLSALVCLHAHHSLPEGAHYGAVSSHLNLSLWDLGLAEPVETIDDSGATRHVMRLDYEALARWVDCALLPLGQLEQQGRLARAALFSLRLAALRTGVVSGPDKPSLAQILDDSAWIETPA